MLDLVAELKKQFDTAIIYITHNLAVVARICDRAGVMYAGQMMEEASVRDLFKAPLHPYTRSLLGCVPGLETNKYTCQLQPIPGQVPPLTNLPPGCVFAPRCSFAIEKCHQERPEIEWAQDGRRVRCFRWQEVAQTELSCPPSVEPSALALTRPKEAEPLLRLHNVKSYYAQNESSIDVLARIIARREKPMVKAVDDITYDVCPGLAFGVVGESGSGKSTLAKCIAGLAPLVSGQILLRKQDLSKPVEKRRRDLLKHLQMVFQNPRFDPEPGPHRGACHRQASARLCGGAPRSGGGTRVRIIEGGQVG